MILDEIDINPFNAICSKLLLFEGFSAILVKPTIITARAYARAVLGVVILSVCPSVRLSVTRVDCDKTK